MKAACNRNTLRNSSGDEIGYPKVTFFFLLRRHGTRSTKYKKKKKNMLYSTTDINKNYQ